MVKTAMARTGMNLRIIRSSLIRYGHYLRAAKFGILASARLLLLKVKAEISLDFSVQYQPLFSIECYGKTINTVEMVSKVSFMAAGGAGTGKMDF